MKELKSPWNSLEIAKLLVSISLPITIFVFGYWTKDALQKDEHRMRQSEKILEKRIKIYEEIRIPLNNIYTYIEEIGSYKDFNPDTNLSDRRHLHKTMHTQRAYWSPRTFSAYLSYMDQIAFKTWQGINTDALIRDDPGQKNIFKAGKKTGNKDFRDRKPEITSPPIMN